MVYVRSRAMVAGLRKIAEIVPLPKPIMFIGPDSSLQLARRIAALGYTKILLVTDKDLTKLGLYAGIQKTLEESGTAVTVYDGILPDPTVQQIEDGIAVYKQAQCEAVLAIGGGSVIDAGKLVAIGAVHDKPLLKYQGYFRLFAPVAPLYAVPTTAGTGSEVTIAAVVSDTVTHRKTAIADPKLVPLMAALDANLMLGLPRNVTIYSGLDALTHAVEAYLSRNQSARTDRYALAAMKTVLQHLQTTVDTPTDVEARQEMSLASYYAGIAFTEANLGYVHAIAHRLGGFYGLPHGCANAIVLPYVLDEMASRHTARMAQLARDVGFATSGNDAQDARLCADKITEFVRSFGAPHTVEKLQQSDIPAIAKQALEEAHKILHYPVAFEMSQRQMEAFVTRMLPA